MTLAEVAARQRERADEEDAPWWYPEAVEKIVAAFEMDPEFTLRQRLVAMRARHVHVPYETPNRPRYAHPITCEDCDILGEIDELLDPPKETIP